MISYRATTIHKCSWVLCDITPHRFFRKSKPTTFLLFLVSFSFIFPHLAQCAVDQDVVSLCVHYRRKYFIDISYRSALSLLSCGIL